MSTRTQLRFVDTDGNTVAQVYNHSDGYPSSIISELADLRDTLKDHGWVRGPGYAAAQFIFIRKLNSMAWCSTDVEKDEDTFDLSNYDHDHFLGGQGVEQGNIHGDEVWIYEVTVPTHHDSEGWSVKVSSNFPEPQWEDRSGELHGYDYPEGEDAWTEATWEYEGDLDGAVTEYAEDE